MHIDRTAISSAVDSLDFKILQVLEAAPRCPFASIAAVLGVSEQTVARRYRRMRDAGIVRVIGLVDPRPLGQTAWTVRIQCRPDATARLADALAARDDVAWVFMTAGGSEIICSMRSLTHTQRDDLLLSRLPNTSQVLSMSAHAALHRFVGDDWFGPRQLTAEQLARLRPPRGQGPSDPVFLEPDDGPMLDALLRDGRASYAALASATGWKEGRVARRLDELRAAGTVYFDVDFALDMLGFHMLAYLWITVPPAELVEVGETLAKHSEIAYVAATTGPSNLQAAAVCRDAEALYHYVTAGVGSVAAVAQVEISPVLRRVKQAGALVAAGRLVDARPPAAAVLRRSASR
jgi:DNA-binding Lrp family transcriptional regulator